METFEYFIGQVYDAESQYQTITIEVSIEPKAQRFISWNTEGNQLTFTSTEATESDLGYYFVSIKLEDNFSTVDIPSYVECQDRLFSSEELKEQCKERENGVTYYDIIFHLIQEEKPAGFTIAPDAALVVENYEGRVYDLGDFTLEEIYDQAVNSFELADEFVLETSLSI